MTHAIFSANPDDYSDAEARAAPQGVHREGCGEDYDMTDAVIEFEFNYCPECGSQDLERPWIFALAGKIRRCRSCGREWHVIAENSGGNEEE